MQTEEYIRNLVTRLLEKIYEEQAKLSLIINECKRIANLRGDYRNLIWLDLESMRLDKSTLNVPFLKYASKFSNIELEKLKKFLFSEWMREREIILIDSEGEINTKEPKILIYSVNEIEAELTSSKEKRASAIDTSGMHHLDKYHIETEKSKTNNFLIDYENGILKILSRIKNRVHEYLLTVELDLIRVKNYPHISKKQKGS